MAGTMALGASMQLLLDAGIPEVWAHVDGLCDRVVDGLSAIDGVRVLSDRSEAGRSAIVSFVVEGVSSDVMAERLNAASFVCSSRGGGVRIAPHGYNTVEEIDALVRATAHEKNR
jgi:selenocysteine lyase/cysteine desulfurase